MIRTLVLSGLLALAGVAAHAQTTLHYREGQRVEPKEVMRILDNVEGSRIRTRSIRLLEDDPAPARPAPAPAASRPSALSLPVRFEFDSATISASARTQLDALAEGIKMLPAERHVVIEGHTDASGPDDYNQYLSQLRAAAVKGYLVQVHAIDAQRLRDAGFGERRPIAGTSAYAAQNRRVQFRGG